VFPEALACAWFLVSGASALAFETLWFEKAGLVFGNDVWASSAVLSAFMLGMAGGQVAAARWAGRVKGLRTFALLEATAGVAGVALVFGLASVESGFASIASGFVDRPVLLNGARVVVAFVAMLLPAAAMGASLPVLTGAFAPSGARYGRVLGLLYGANTAGGVVGVLVTEGYLVARFGVQGSALFAGAGELFVAGTAFVFASRVVPLTPSETELVVPVVDRRRWAWRGSAFVSGFALLALEVVWVRILTLFVDDTSSAFAAILAVVLAGIALGGLFAGAWLGKWEHAVEQLPRAAYAAGLVGVAGYAAYASVLARFYIPEAPPWRVALIASPLVLPVSLCSGVLFTLAGAGLRRSATSIAATAELAAINTVGAALGSLAAGFVLVPGLGMERALFLLLALYGVVGFAVSATAARRRAVHYGELAVFAVLMAFFPFGKMRDAFIQASAQRWMRNTGHLVEVREARAGTLVHIRHEIANIPICDQVVTNAYSMTANDFLARRYMKFFVYLPVAMKPKVSRALLIAYGMGNTAKALVDTREIERIDVVDTSQEMLDISRHVLPAAPVHPLDDPRVHVHIGDGRYFLQSTPEEYDLITGEPPPPVMAHVSSLYSAEYFALLRERLAAGGMVTYWLPTMNLGAPATRSLVAGFCSVFEDCSLWGGAKENFVLVGSREPGEAVDFDRFVAQWREADVVPELQALGFEFPGQLGATFVGDAAYLKALTRDDAPLTDDFPKRLLAKGTPEEKAKLILEWRNVAAARERFKSSEFTERAFSAPVRRQILQHFENQRLFNDLIFTVTSPARQLNVLDQVLSHTPLKLPALLLLKSDPDVQRALASVPASEEHAPALLRHETARYLVARDPRGALPFVRQIDDAALALPGLKSYVEEHALAASDAAPR
jgi:predicted membrane-bound spermidine synthase